MSKVYMLAKKYNQNTQAIFNGPSDALSLWQEIYVKGFLTFFLGSIVFLGCSLTWVNALFKGVLLCSCTES